MLYREAGDFKTSYAEDQSDLPDPSLIAGATLSWFLAVAFMGSARCLINDYWAERCCYCRSLIYSIAALGVEHPDRDTADKVQLGDRRLYGRGRLCLLQADDGSFPEVNIAFHVIMRLSGGVTAIGMALLFGLPSSTDQGLLPGRGDPCGAVLLSSGSSTRFQLVLQLLRLWSDQRPRSAQSLACAVTGANTDALGDLSYLFCLDLRWLSVAMGRA